MKFYIVDAFTNSLFGGNPAGVVFLDKGAEFPEDELMRRTAAELRYSETAFVKQLAGGDFEIRYFTPAAEVDLCGHATIGTFSALLAEGEIHDPGNYGCRTKAGLLNIQVEQGTIMMDMAAPRWLGEIEKDDELNDLYHVMGIPGQTRSDFTAMAKSQSPHLLPALISTGLPDIIMPVPSKEILDALKPNFPLLTELSKKYEVVGVHAFAFGDDKVTAYCRNFAPLYEIDEEAATGTSNGALTYYLYHHGIIKASAKNTIIQGEAMKRPSVICSRLCVDEKIQVGGRAVVLASGIIYL